jgi:hypothetical protein
MTWKAVKLAFLLDLEMV